MRFRLVRKNEWPLPMHQVFKAKEKRPSLSLQACKEGSMAFASAPGCGMTSWPKLERARIVLTIWKMHGWRLVHNLLWSRNGITIFSTPRSIFHGGGHEPTPCRLQFAPVHFRHCSGRGLSFRL